MSDKKTFPNVDPPPSPDGDNRSQSEQGGQPVGSAAAPSPFDVMVPAPQTEAETTNQSGQVQGQFSQPQQSAVAPQNMQLPPKKGFPKIVLYILGGLVLVIVIIIVINVIRSGGGTKLFGTKGKIVWWGISDEPDIVTPLIAEYQKQNPNVQVIYTKVSETDYRERLTNALANGTGPDIFEMHNSWEPMFRRDLAPAPSNIISKEEFASSFYAVNSTDLVNDAGVIAMPLEYDALTLYINDDIFTSALKPVPKTWDELATVAKELTQVGPNKLIIQAGVALGLTENVDHWQDIIALMLLQNGVNLAKPQEQLTRDVVIFYSNFFKFDKVWDSTQPVSTDAFARGKLAMYFAPTSKAAEIRSENPNLRFRTIPLPQLPKNRPDDPDISYATYWVQGVYSRSINSEVSWDFLNYLASPKSLQELNRLRRESGQLEKAYPRPDMAVIQKNDRILGSVLAHAPSAFSWYLAGDTFDGPTGINSQIGIVYENLLQGVLGNKDFNVVLKALPAEISTVLAKYNSQRR